MTLFQSLVERSASTPTRLACGFLDSHGEQADTRTYEELYAASSRTAALLSEHARPGDRVVLTFSPGLDFLAAFFGCLAAGVTAVPLYPPQTGAGRRGVPRLLAVLEDAQPAAVLADARARAALSQVEELEGRRVLAFEESAACAPRELPTPSLEALAFLQYTSGSTAAPKGVKVTHRNLIENIRYIDAGMRYTSDDVLVSWLPVYHDMGLIWGTLLPIVKGFAAHLMSPLTFLQQPFRWLDAVSRLGATHTAGPNFALDMCVRRITPQQRQTLDLQRLQALTCCAEPIRASTLEAFERAFRPLGLREGVIGSAYGLAEGTLKVTASTRDARIPSLTVARGPLTDEHRIAAGEGAEATELVSSGRVGPGATIRIVDPARGIALGERQIGEIWIRGPSVALGYWGRDEQSKEVFEARLDSGDGPFLRSGDLGFVADGELFVTGRIKDLIIIAGRNVYPQDLEWSAEAAHEAIRPGGVAALALDGGSTEAVGLVAEVDPRFARAAVQGEGKDLAEVVQAIRARLFDDHELAIAQVALIPAGTLPKTSSGKVQRQQTRRLLTEGGLQTLASWIAEASPAALAGRDGDASLQTAERMQLALARILSVRREAVRLDAPLRELGLDSIRAVEFSHWLVSEYALEVELTALMACENLHAVARHVDAQRADAARANEEGTL